MTIEIARLRWRCRRGMRELDAVLKAYLDGPFATLAAPERARFAAILELPDPELYAYLAGRATPPDPADAELIANIRRSLPPET